jgi:RNA polymerase sigma-70 factor, ECF subfamily
LIEGESNDDRPDDDRLDDAAQNAAQDLTLLRGYIEGDPDAFARLVARHQDRMWSIALGIMRNPQDAADALQDAYIAAFRRAGSYRGDARVTTWLHRVVVNACLDRLGMMRSRETEPLQKILIDGAGWARH